MIRYSLSNMISDIVKLAIIVVPATFILVGLCKSSKEKKEAESFRKVATTDINEKINKATFVNDNFDVDQKAQAYSVLTKYKKEIENANKVDDVNDSIIKFNYICDMFTRDKDSAVALLKYETQVIKNNNDIAERNIKIDADNSKYKIMADAIGTLGKDILKSKALGRDLTEFTIREILK